MLRTLCVILILLFIPSSPLEGKTVQVRGYYRKDGTYVRPHTRSSPGSNESYTPPAFVPPPVMSRMAYQSSARTAARTAVPSIRNVPRSDSDEPRTEQPQVSRPLYEKYPFRLWKDNTGQFQVTARFRSYANGTVKIERQDNGKIIEIQIERLSPADQKYIRGLLK
jgi:hypothetical protein